MDFPKSVPGVGLVNGRFVDEDAAAARPGSLVPSAWGNSITLEILNVLAAAGVAPDELKTNQLADAISKIVTGSSIAWNKITGKPATLSGYGITDAYTISATDNLLASKANKATTLSGYGITDAMPVVGGNYRPKFSEVAVTAESFGYSNSGGYIGWGPGAGLTNSVTFINNKGSGNGGFTWRTVNGDNSQSGPTMSYLYDGTLNIPFGLTVPAVFGNTVVNTQATGFSGGYIANCAYTVATINAAIVGVNNSINQRILGDFCSVAGLASNDPAQPYMRQSSTGNLVILSTANNALGNTQTWQDMTSGRAAATTYTNTTGRPIAISIYTTLVTNWIASITVSGVVVAANTTNNMTSGGVGTLSAIVPTGASYSFSVSNAGISKWMELR